ncbi:hypothetical protein HDV06_001450 [Boothiomyces sp. JEL0866]|nr:hypothetical protein HDV06_001450 [Boothiomyces sp. JEL0866]
MERKDQSKDWIHPMNKHLSPNQLLRDQQLALPAPTLSPLLINSTIPYQTPNYMYDMINSPVEDLQNMSPPVKYEYNYDKHESPNSLESPVFNNGDYTNGTKYVFIPGTQSPPTHYTPYNYNNVIPPDYYQGSSKDYSAPMQPLAVTTFERPNALNCFCGLTFESQKEFNKHEKTHKPVVKPHACETCFRAFTRRQDLKRHQATHTQTFKPYKCDKCGTTFTRSDALHRHVKAKRCGD